MDLGSNSKHMSMGGSFGDNNLHAEHQTGGGVSASSKQPLLGGIAKGSLNSTAAANPANSNTNNNLNLSSLGSLTHANLFNSTRPDNHTNINAGQSGAVSDTLTLKKNGTTNINSISNNNNNSNSNNNNNNNNNNIASGITNITRSNSGGNITSTNVSDKNNNSSNANGGVRYKECLKNHAANMGGYAVDGCGEFMPSGEEGSLEALKCAACGCHRNFHRRETNGGSVGATTSNSMSLLALPSTINTSNTSTSNSDYGEGDHNHSNSAIAGSGSVAPFAGHYNAGHMGPALLPHLHHHHHHQYMQAWMGGKLVQPAGTGPGHHAGMHVHHGTAGGAGQYSYMGMGGPGHLGGGHGAGGGGHAGGSKRFRTKFTMEQREKMFEFSEKVGWRIHKHDEAAVQQFCAEAGVKRHVLKVWMHNNKNTFGKKLGEGETHPEISRLRFPEAFNALPESSS